MLRPLCITLLSTVSFAIMQRHSSSQSFSAIAAVDSAASLEVYQTPTAQRSVQAAQHARLPWIPGRHRHDATAMAELPQDVIYHLHIPKAAGISFGIDALKFLRPHNLKLASREGCYSWKYENPRVLGTAVLLRNPRKHVVSMYDFCLDGDKTDYRNAVRPPSSPTMPEKIQGWVTEWKRLQDSGWHGNFTPPSEPVSGIWNYTMETVVRKRRIPAWSEPPFSPESTFLDEKDWVTLDGGGTLWHYVKVPFQCYSPLSLQTQRLTCSKPMEFSSPPNITQALDNLGSAWFVGIAEHYQASICLLQLQLGEALPKYCDCRNPQQWKTFPGTRENDGKHKTKLDELSQDTLRQIDELTAMDWQLYKAGEQRFVREVRKMEQVHNTKILCNFTATV
mmetsp:Transcript_142103/g.345252  ORF Transcript_142103/g.345252 Transcript_142103/m.345252 type:complete len:393 (-) Transcript_142103:80-1258(-)